MTSPTDTPDWVTSSALQYADVPLATRGAADNGAYSPLIDVSQYQSVSLLLTTNAVDIANYLQGVLTWSDGVRDVGQDDWTTQAPTIFQLVTGRSRLTVPVRARYVRVKYNQNATAQIVGATLSGSAKPADQRGLLADANSGTGRQILVVTAGAMAAGASNTYYLPPVDRAFTISGLAPVPAIVCQVQSLDAPAGGFAFNLNDRLTGNTANGGWSAGAIQLPRRAVRLVVTNTDTVSRVVGITVQDVS